MTLDPDEVKSKSDIVRVIGGYLELKRNGHAGEFVGLCPFHRESTPSFTVTASATKQLFYCFGCEATGDVFKFIERIEGVAFPEALQRVALLAGMDTSSMAPRSTQRDPVREDVAVKSAVTAVYPYFDRHRNLAYEVLRIEPGRRGQKKDFSQRRPHPTEQGSWITGMKAGIYRKNPETGHWNAVKDDTRAGDQEFPECERLLFHLPDVMESSDVWVCEGEKDALTLERLGYCGTTPSGGAKHPWLPSYSECLRRKRVVVVPDNDEPGHKKANLIVGALKGIAAAVLLLVLPGTVKDITEWVEAGGTRVQLDELVAKAQREEKRADIESRGLLTPEEIVQLFEGGINAFLDPSSRKPGLKTGFRQFDDMTLGLHDGELIILAARPSMGKTALALNVAMHAARGGNPVAIFSLEMSRESLLTRAICSFAYMDQMKYRAGFMSRDDRRKVSQAFVAIAAMPMLIDDHPSTSLETIKKKLTIMKSERGLRLVIVDYLQLMTTKGAENRNQEVGALSRGLKLMAREFDVPFVVLSQLSRAPDTRSGSHRPQLSDLRESGGIEQDADLVAFIYREEVYKPDREDLRGLAELIIAKQRNGPVGTAKLTFLNSITKFENRAEDVDEPTSSAQPQFAGDWQ